MKNYLFTFSSLFLFSLALLNGCSEVAGSSSNQGNEATEKSAIQEEAFPTGNPIEFKVLKFDKDQVPNLGYKGEIQAGAYWQDKAGLNYYLITLKKAKLEGSVVRKLHFLKDSKGAKWMGGHENVVESGAQLKDHRISDEFIKTSDLNGDNLGEVTFSYHTLGSEQSPISIEANLFENGEFAISKNHILSGGLEYSPEGDLITIPYRSLLPEFEEAPIEFQEHLIKSWEAHLAFVKKELEGQ